MVKLTSVRGGMLLVHRNVCFEGSNPSSRSILINVNIKICETMKIKQCMCKGNCGLVKIIKDDNSIGTGAHLAHLVMSVLTCSSSFARFTGTNSTPNNSIFFSLQYSVT